MNEEEKQKVGKRFFDFVENLPFTPFGPSAEEAERRRELRRSGKVLGKYGQVTQAIGDAKNQVLGTVFSPLAKGVQAISDATNIDERAIPAAAEIIITAVGVGKAARFPKSTLVKSGNLGRRLGGKLPTVDGSALDDVVDVVNPYKVTSQTQRDILSQVNNKITSVKPITITSTGNVPVVVAKRPTDPLDFEANKYEQITNLDSYDVDPFSPTYGQLKEEYNQVTPTKLANELRATDATQLAKESAPNVTPQMQSTLVGSITDIPGYRTVVGSADIFDYNVIRQLIAGGRITGNKVTARDFLERFQSPVTVGGVPQGVDFGRYRAVEVPKLRRLYGPALDALGLPRNAAQIHHIAALHAISGIHHGLGYNSVIYRQVNDAILQELPDYAKGLGSMSGNLMPIIGGGSDTPHYYAHLFYTDVLGGHGEKFFTPKVLNTMLKSKSYRLKKAKELGQIIAQSERIAAQAMKVYEVLYAQGTSISFQEIMDVMMEMNSQGLLPRNIMSPRYQVKALENLIKDINLSLEIEQLNPSLDVMRVLSTRNRRNIDILRDIIASGGTGEDAQKALNKLYGKPLKGGAKQTDFFEDIIDVENFLEKYRIEARNKREAAKRRKNQKKYFEDPSVTK
tara:strand:- start:43 stop:1917 length:1875 start_codon:yes stop_codon:yes gene_type:complete